MEKSETVVEGNRNGRASLINHSLVKAFIAGFVLAMGLLITSLFNEMLGVRNWNTINFPIAFVFYIFLPITFSYLTLRLINNFLKRFGFEGVKIHQNEKLDTPKLFSATLGCFAVLFLLMIVIETGSVIFILGSVYVGETKFKLLIGAFVVGILAFFALARRVSHNQAKEQQETQ